MIHVSSYCSNRIKETFEILDEFFQEEYYSLIFDDFARSFKFPEFFSRFFHKKPGILAGLFSFALFKDDYYILTNLVNNHTPEDFVKPKGWTKSSYRRRAKNIHNYLIKKSFAVI